jgi:hypothetical protein
MRHENTEYWSHPLREVKKALERAGLVMKIPDGEQRSLLGKVQNICTKDLDLEEIPEDTGIYNFPLDFDTSFGVSCETRDDGQQVFIFNLMCNGIYTYVAGEYVESADGVLADIGPCREQEPERE